MISPRNEIISPRRDSTSDETLYDTTEEKEFKTSGLTGYADPNNLLERLQLLVLETKAGNYGFIMKC